jgi:radical S-adenosyl methionine domain-containing protein 2
MIVNLHILDACDFRCTHCFAHFGARKALPCKDWQIIVDNILGGINVERFNLAGGEPILYIGRAELTEYIRSRGSAVSIITNGYSLSDKKIDLLGESGVSMIGLSVDSPNTATLRRLGRCTISGDILTPARCISIVEKTMVNAYVMVDAFGNLVDTGSVNNTPAGNLLKVSFSDAFARLKFDYGIYQARYAA